MVVTNFLRLLPLDLQICVLQTWISGAKAVALSLSALDMAYCQKAIRHAVLALFRSLLPIGSEDERILVNDDLGLVLWLSARGLKAVVLSLRCLDGIDDRRSETLCLPSIKTIYVAMLCIWQKPSFAALLRACPNVTSVRVFSTDQDSKELPIIWDVLEAHPRKLASLTLPDRDGDAMISCLQSIGPYVRRLGLRKVDLQLILPVLMTCVPNLQSLSVQAVSATTNNLVELLHTCKHLEELELAKHSLTQEGLDVLLTAGRGQLKKFKADKRGTEFFLSMLENHPWLEQIHLAGHEYCRSTGKLMFNGATTETTSDLLCIFSACPRISALHYPNISLSLLGDESASKCLVGKLSEHLEELVTVWDAEKNTVALRLLLPRCVHLQRIELNCDVEDWHFELIAKHCPELMSLSVRSSATPTGVLQVISACHKLKELTIADKTADITCILQAILDSRLRLSKLTCSCELGEKRNILAVEVEQFKIQAREQQLLPVPVVEYGVHI